MDRFRGADFFEKEEIRKAYGSMGLIIEIKGKSHDPVVYFFLLKKFPSIFVRIKRFSIDRRQKFYYNINVN